tara:strand:+ start:730 stop:1362 length:633 start_codon:yes stop_codon:yes gene_type:complete
METLSERIKYLLQATGTKQADLARLINVKPQVINFLCENNAKNSRFTFDIASVLGVNPKWLVTGEGIIFLDDDPRYKLFTDYQIVSVITPNEIIDSLKNLVEPEGDGQQYAPIRSALSSVYAMIVSEPSMSPCIPVNSIVFFQWNPNLKPVNNTYVVIYAEEYSTILIRKFEMTNNRKIFSVINEEFYRPIEDSKKIKIIGEVVANYVNF